MQVGFLPKILVFGLLGLILAAAPWITCASLQVENGTVLRTIEVNGLARDYRLHVPGTYNSGAPVPLVLVLHGATQSPEAIERMSEMSALSDKHGFIAVYPRGTGRLPAWNAGNCCAYALDRKIDDVGFIRALIDKLEGDYSVDAKRIFVAGISNGGMMSYRLACELSDKVAGVAPVEGAQNVDCRPSNRVSVIVFHGTADRLVPFEGGSTPFQLGPKRTDNAVSGAVAFWVQRDGCSSEPMREQYLNARVAVYSACQDGAGVALYAIEGGRHMWPGRPLSGNAIPATDLMWSFFTQHPKP